MKVNVTAEDDISVKEEVIVTSAAQADEMESSEEKLSGFRNADSEPVQPQPVSTAPPTESAVHVSLTQRRVYSLYKNGISFQRFIYPKLGIVLITRKSCSELRQESGQN